MAQKCKLQLSNGDELEGRLLGAPLTASGEMVFTTGMVGYCEALTDPSYFGQILVFSYPLIGNYGIPKLPKELALPIPIGFESPKVHTSGVIITVDSPETFHWNSFQTLDQLLAQEGVPGISGLDTRHLIHLIRDNHGLKGRIIPEQSEGSRHYGETLPVPGPDQYFDPGAHEIIREVSTPFPVEIGTGDITIGLIDCGVKWNIVRQLVESKCRVRILPWNTDLSKENDVDGWLISNGPGNPELTGDLAEKVAGLLKGSKPILGICLGHQILALAAGCKTEKMRYGHRSHNQPVNLLGTRKGFITSQNHGYVVKDESLPNDWEPWFRNVNDQSSEGIKHKVKPFRSVQFHPEAAGGPRDTSWILADYVSEVRKECR